MSSSTFRTLTADAVEGVAVYKDYIKNGRATVNTDGWSTYADAAGATPVDGTGGSPNVTWTRTTSSPLSGDASFLFTKDAANRQGQGVSYTFTIDSADDNGGLFNSPLSYSPDTGTYSGGSSSTDSDLTVYLVSLEFGTVIQPSYYRLQASVNGKAAKATPVFQLPVSAGGGNARKFRLCIHIATTSTAAYTVKFDDIKVSPQPQSNVQYGSFKLPTVQKFTSTGAFTWNRPDGCVYIKVKGVGGGGGGGGSATRAGNNGGAGSSGNNTTFGSSIAYGGGSGAGGTTAGAGGGGTGGSAFLGGDATYGSVLAGGGGGTRQDNGSTTTLYIIGGIGGASVFGGAGPSSNAYGAGGAGSANTGGGGAGASAGADSLSGSGAGSGGYFELVINNPSATISGNVGVGGTGGTAGTGGAAGGNGGSGIVIVEEYYTPTDAGLQTSSLCSYTHAGGQTINTSWATILFETKTVDDGALYDTGTGKLTFTQGGDYTVLASMLSSGVTLSTSQSVQLRVRKNGSDDLCQSVTYGNGVLNSYGVITGKTFRVNAGDYIEVQGYSDSSTTTSVGAAMFNYFSVVKQNSSQVSPSEKIAAKYTSVTADAIGTSLATLTYPTKVFDTHNAYSSGFFTAPSPGKYFFKASVVTNPVTLSTGQSLAIEVRKNSSTLIDSAQTIGNGASNYWSVQTSGFVDLNAGETIDVQVKSSVATVVGAAANYNTFEIFRI